MFCCIKCISSNLSLEGALRPKAVKCRGQRFATSTAQSCATLPVQELPVTSEEDAKPRRTRLQCQSLPAASRISANPPSRFSPPPRTESLLLLLQAYVITYFATSSSTKSPARIADIGKGKLPAGNDQLWSKYFVCHAHSPDCQS